MSGRMSCDCGWLGTVQEEPGKRSRCPDCHAPLQVPPLPDDSAFGEFAGKPAIEEPSAAVRLARRKRQSQEREGDDDEFARTTEVDQLMQEEVEAARRRDLYRPSIFLSPRALSALGMFLIGGVWLAIDLGRESIPVIPIVFLALGCIQFVRAFLGAEEV